jgi:hypothetical protein
MTIIHFLILHYLTFSANLNEHMVWLKSVTLGEILTSINVLLSPYKYFWRRNVSFEFRNGMWDYFFAKAEITTPRWVNDLFIDWVYFILSPYTLLKAIL